MEVFRDVVGYEGQYKIGSCGTLWSERSRKVLRPNTDKDGYGYYVLCVNGKRKTIKTHRLVATAFLPNENNLPSVNHKDEDKLNNAVENLEWCDVAYNNRYGTRGQRISESQINHPAFSKKVLCVETGEVFASTHEAARRTTAHTVAQRWMVRHEDIQKSVGDAGKLLRKNRRGKIGKNGSGEKHWLFR